MKKINLRIMIITTIILMMFGVNVLANGNQGSSSDISNQALEIEEGFTKNQLLARDSGGEIAETFVFRNVVNNTCAVIANGQFTSGVNEMLGAEWRLCDDGVLIVDEGFIDWTGGSNPRQPSSPWNNYRYQITEIIFTGSITAGTSLTHLFSVLENVITIEGLEYFDTSNVINMSHNSIFQLGIRV